MIDIETAIRESKNMKNISNGGSECFDFGNVVLVKYTCSTQYLKKGERARNKSEKIMASVNRKADEGVNTPRHFGVKRVIEGNLDVCYVLQEKCPGYNCASRFKYDVSFDEMCESLKYILNIPFEHYQKLIIDGCKLFEMGCETKNKNLFYDEKSGFWYIDFLDYNDNFSFDPNNIKQVFKAILYVIPKPVHISSTMCYDAKLTEEEEKRKNDLEYAVKAKTLLAIKSVFPNFSKYEKFYLLEEDEKYKKYLMKENIVNQDLINITPQDYEVFHELYEIVMDGLIDKIVNKNAEYWCIVSNDIRNEGIIFRLSTFFEKSKYNNIKKEDFSDEYDYEYEVDRLYESNILNDLISRLKKMEPNENIIKFLNDADEQLSRKVTK